MKKCDKPKYFSNIGSVKNNFKTILKDFYGAYNISERRENLNNKMLYHRKILVFGYNVLLIDF